MLQLLPLDSITMSVWRRSLLRSQVQPYGLVMGHNVMPFSMPFSAPLRLFYPYFCTRMYSQTTLTVPELPLVHFMESIFQATGLLQS